jgi:hypothetical protein
MPNYSDNNTETTPQLRLPGNVEVSKSTDRLKLLVENISFQVNQGRSRRNN